MLTHSKSCLGRLKNLAKESRRKKEVARILKTKLEVICHLICDPSAPNASGGLEVWKTHFTLVKRDDRLVNDWGVRQAV